MADISRQVSPESLRQDPVLAEILKRLVNAYQPGSVYLFGSKARGDEGPDSDYDLMVVVPDASTRERTVSRLAYEVLWGTGTAADVIVWTQSRFENRKGVAASLPATVLREGVLLYELLMGKLSLNADSGPTND